MRYLKVDYDKCNGGAACQRECETACATTFFKSANPAFSAIRLLPVAKGAEELRINVCDQCGECVALCPTEALRSNKLGIVLVDKKTCLGCLMCMGGMPHSGDAAGPRDTARLQVHLLRGLRQGLPDGRPVDRRAHQPRAADPGPAVEKEPK